MRTTQPATGPGRAAAPAAPATFGLDCVAPCPSGAAAPCSGHGLCSDGVAGTGACACAAGYAGPECAKTCPGLSQGRICNAHGRCDATTGACACDAGDAASGYWTGATCGDCQDGWSGAGCDVACPRDTVLGAVCGAHGACVTGTCVCDAGFCGTACELSGLDCRQCPAGMWGPSCGNECPGGAATPCNGHGQCLDGALGSGQCLCAAGYALADCGQACPVGAAGAECAGHGACDAATAKCLCAAGYAGAACGTACPRDLAVAGAPVCGGPRRGLCDDGATNSGQCRCEVGFVGIACQHDCRGMGPDGPCHGHGQCVIPGDCQCYGHWAGAECAVCEGGWFGPDCAQRCIEGSSVSLTCVCRAGWAGPDCSTECVGGAASPCNGHGACNETRVGDGTCTCDTDWRGPACAVPCPGVEATGRACAGHGTCNGTAACTCARSPVEGYWEGDACTRCAYGHAGFGCTLLCPGFPGPICGGHGACNPFTAACECFKGPEDGYWAEDSNCTDCVPGYFGAECQSVCPGGTCAICSGHGSCSDRGRRVGLVHVRRSLGGQRVLRLRERLVGTGLQLLVPDRRQQRQGDRNLCGPWPVPRWALGLRRVRLRAGARRRHVGGPGVRRLRARVLGPGVPRGVPQGQWWAGVRRPWRVRRRPHRHRGLHVRRALGWPGVRADLPVGEWSRVQWRGRV